MRFYTKLLETSCRADAAGSFFRVAGNQAMGVRLRRRRHNDPVGYKTGRTIIPRKQDSFLHSELAPGGPTI